MIVMINGSFGVGKSTVARHLRRALAGSVIYDPEWVGFVLMRLPGRRRASRPESDDFQHIGLWRRSAVAGARLFRRLARGPVIIPMAFCHLPYLDEVAGGIGRFERDLRLFCLRASAETVRRRLAGRGTRADGPGAEWIARRVAECAEVHRDPRFGEPVDTEGRPAREVADEIVRRLAIR